MRSHVDIVRGLVAERFPTYTTGVRFFTRVYSEMNLQIVFQVETLATF